MKDMKDDTLIKEITEILPYLQNYDLLAIYLDAKRLKDSPKQKKYYGDYVGME